MAVQNSAKRLVGQPITAADELSEVGIGGPLWAYAFAGTFEIDQTNIASIEVNEKMSGEKRPMLPTS